MLEGKEIDKEFDGGAGKYFVDVDAKGKVEVGMSYEKDLDGYAKVKSMNSVDTNIFDIAEKITKKTNATWDDKAVAGLKALLGMADSVD